MEHLVYGKGVVDCARRLCRIVQGSWCAYQVARLDNDTSGSVVGKTMLSSLSEVTIASDQTAVR